MKIVAYRIWESKGSFALTHYSTADAYVVQLNIDIVDSFCIFLSVDGKFLPSIPHLCAPQRAKENSMGNLTQQIQNIWSKFEITGSAREKMRSIWFSFLIASIWIVGGIATLGPLDSRMTDNLKNRTFGETYFVAKGYVLSVKNAKDVSSIRSSGSDLANWLENQGTEFVIPKKNGPADSYAVRKATSDLKAAVSETPADRHDVGYQAYRIRASAAAVPLEAFRTNAATSGSWLFDRILIFALIGSLITGIASWLTAVKEKKTGFSRSLSVFSGFPGGIIGGAIVGFVTGIVNIGMLI